METFRHVPAAFFSFRPRLRNSCVMTRYFAVAILLIGGVLTSGSMAADSIRVSTDFPGGSATVVEIDQKTATIEIQPNVLVDRGWPCWWFLRIDGLTTGQTVTLKVSANPKPYRAKSVLSASWMQPDRAVYSNDESDRSSWRQTGKCQREGEVATYQFEASSATMWVAWGVPFLPSDAERLLDVVSHRLPGSERFELARTRGGRPVPGIRIGGGTADKPARFGIWVQARQHAWESGGSWVGRGFIDWASSDDADAVALREIATIHYVPIMDVDCVSIGAGGKDATPRDHNRDWSDEPVYPEVAAAQKLICRLDQARRFDVFLDLHNPGPNEQRPYFFGPDNLNELPALQQQNHARWLAIAQEEIAGPLPLLKEYMFATYVKTEEERGRMSATWVRNHTSPHVLSTTLETAWNTPHSQPDGYSAVGRQLAQTVFRYLTGRTREAQP